MELNSRCSHLLREVVKEKGDVSVAALLSQLDITKRALYYDLSKINDWLLYHKLGSITPVGKSLTLNTKDRHAIIERLNSFSSYQFSVDERHALELFLIALDSAPVTSESLQQLFDVSKNTILNDIKDWKILLKKYQLKIENAKGYKLVGEEIAIRKLIGQQTYRLQSEYPKSILLSKMQNVLAELTGNTDVDFWQLVRRGVRDYEQSINTYLVLSDMGYEIVMIMVACIRSLKGMPYVMDAQEKDALKNAPEYGAVLLIIRGLYDARVNLAMDESYYITILFLGIKNFDFNTTSAENDYIQQFSKDLIYNFEQIACVTFLGKKNFFNRLYQHIRPMYYRLKYGIRAGNALLGQIQSMYTAVYDYTERALKMTGGEICSLITEEEIAYLCIYMTSYLSESTPAPPHRKSPHILIICGVGVAASVLLREQLIELLGDSFRYQLAPGPKAALENLADYSLVVSTVPMDSERDNVICTGPILSDETKDMIITAINRMDIFPEANHEANEILALVKKNGPVSDENKLFLDLLRYFIKKERPHPKVVWGLDEFIRHGVLVKSDASELSQAIRDACWFLGAPATLFAEKIEAQILSRGKAREICRGVALEHLASDSHDDEVGLGIAFTHKPICFGDQNIWIFIVLRTVDNFTHYPLLNEIYGCFGNRNLCDKLIGESTDIKMVEKVLLQHIS